MKLSLFLSTIATVSFSVACADNASVLLERQIGSLMKTVESAPDTVKPEILCAAALGYLSAGNLAKAKACHKSLSECDGENGRFLEIFTNGLLRTTCVPCKGDGILERTCRRCEGKGRAEALKGTVSKCLMCSGLGRVGIKCDACAGKGFIEFDAAICASLCLHMTQNISAGVSNNGEAWEDLLMRSAYGSDPEDEDVIMGVPRSVFLRIRAKAEADWPDNYGMQKFRIENEVKDYKALKSIH